MAEKTAKRTRRFKHWEVIAFYLAAYDIVMVNFSYFLGLWLRFDFRFSLIPRDYLYAFLKFTPVYTVFAIGCFCALRLYNSLWRFASFNELNRIFAASVITTLFHTAGITLFVKRMPISYYMMGTVFQFGFMTVVRFSYRFINLERSRRGKSSETAKRVMVIGAGSAGQIIIRDLKNSSGDAIPVCIIDDNDNKWGRLMDGIPVVGGRHQILEMVKKYKVDQILYAIPTATAESKRDILNICKETGCELKSLSGIYRQADDSQALLSKMRPVAVEDLLGRETIKVNMDEIFQHIRGKRILVTGGGGSIGSELCRQIAGHGPEQLVIFDIYENNAYDIQQELKRKYGDKLNLAVLIGSVRDSRRVEQVFETYRPQIVYHAAAHKHVPLMEGSPCESIKNNVLGTYKTAYAAMKYNAERFVLISTDKAVNPTNIMGASKRLCEMVIQCMDAVSRAGRMDLLPSLHKHKSMDAWSKQGEQVGQARQTDRTDRMVWATQDRGTNRMAQIAQAMQTEGMSQTAQDGRTTQSVQAEPLIHARQTKQAVQTTQIERGSGRTDSADRMADAGNAAGTSRHLDVEFQEKGGKIRIEAVKNKYRTGTQYAAVRFGNVLGSNGSVIPLFKKQIAEGGPVTVTDPEMTRYFMTIPEAVSLVLQAGTYAWGGEIFVLDMGEPVKIDDLARNLIQLSGHKPDEDIKIEYIGLRPGEKLYEEKLMVEEGMKKTDNELIHIGKPIEFDAELFLREMEALAEASYRNDAHIVEMVEKMVATFHPVGANPKGSMDKKRIRLKVLERQEHAVRKVKVSAI